MKKQEIDAVFDEHMEIYLFSQTSVRIQLHDTRALKNQSENRKLNKQIFVSRKVYLFHTNLSPNSITLVIYTYRLRLPFWTLEFEASLSAIYALLSRSCSQSHDFAIPSSPCYLTIVRLGNRYWVHRQQVPTEDLHLKYIIK